MIETIIKIGLTSLLVVAIAEAAKRSSMLGALIASLPLTSILAMIWLYADTGDVEKVANLATGVFWLVIPSLILFITLPLLLRSGFGFVPSLMLASVCTITGYFAMIYVLRFFDIEI